MPLFNRWQSKPDPGTPIDWGHPLSQGLIAAYALNEGAGIVLHDSAQMQADVITESTNYSWPGYYDGVTLKNSDTDHYTRQASTYFPYVSEFTVASDFVDSRVDNTGGIFYLGGGGGDPAGALWSGSTTLTLRSAFPVVNLTVTAAQQTRRRYVLLLGIATFEIWWDGVQQVTTAGYGTGGANSGYFPARLYLGCEGGGNVGTPTANYYYFWNRILTPNDIAAISWNPWQIFLPRTAFRLIHGIVSSGRGGPPYPMLGTSPTKPVAAGWV